MITPRRTATIVLGALLLALSPPRATAQAPRGTITGRVLDGQTREPLPRARVIVLGLRGLVVASAATGDGGGFVLAAVPVGRYVVEAVRIGYEKRAVIDVAVLSGDTTRLEFRLAPVAVEAGRIVIMGARRLERVTDADVRVVSIDGARLEERHEASLQAALGTVAGLDVFETGLGQQQANGRGVVSPFGSNLLVLVDGRLASAPGHAAPLSPMLLAPQNDLDRVDIVAGPTAALYGANAAAGVLDIVTRDPLTAPGSAISVTTGTRGTIRVAARTSAMTAAGKLGYKIAGESYDANDFARYNTFIASDPLSGRIVARRTDAPDFDISNRTLSGGVFAYPTEESRVALQAGVERASYVNQTNVARLQLKDWDSWFYSLRASTTSLGGLGSAFAQASLTANDAGNSYYLDQAARYQFPAGVADGRGLSLPDAVAAARFVDRSRRWDAELQHAVQLAGRLNLTTGAQLHRTMPRTEGTWMDDPPDGRPLRITEAAVYSQAEAYLAPPLRLTLVGRWDDHSELGGRFSPKVSLSYSAGAHTVRLTRHRGFDSPPPYLLHARSFVARRGAWDVWNRGARYGFTFVNEAGGPVPAPLPKLGPLGVTSTEIGYRGAWGARLSIDVALHASRYDGFPTSAIEIGDPDAGIFAVHPRTGQVLREVTRTFANYGTLPVRGADVVGQWNVTGSWNVDASASLQEPGAFRNARAGAPEPGFNAPTHTYRAGVSYRGWWRPTSYAELTGRRVSRFYFVSGLPYTTGDVPARTTLDLDVGLPLPYLGDDGRAVALTVKNLLDRRHIELPGGAELRRVVLVSMSSAWR